MRLFVNSSTQMPILSKPCKARLVLLGHCISSFAQKPRFCARTKD